MQLSSAKLVCCLVVVAAIINSTLTLQMSAHISRGFNSQSARRISGYQCTNPNCLKSIRKSARLRSAPQSQNQTRDSLRKYNHARRGYRIAPVGYIYCGTFDTPKHWLDTEHINSTSNSPLSTITATRTLTEKVC